ncbi:MAG: dihydrodipicolinate synthase family protein [Acidobacteria bacterium]|nr:dihydrodipicolinate synthase family protein [Acidobacteriota bacterium]
MSSTVLFTGAHAAIITPSRPESYQMDLAATLEVIDFLCDCKVRGIAMFGATGEFPHFAVEDRIRLTHMAIKRSRVPVLVNATHSCLAEASAIAEHAASNGAAAVMIQPPAYFRYDGPEVREYFLRFIDDVDGTIPVLLYNLPAFNNAIPIAVAQELLENGTAAGIKDSSGDWDYFCGLMESRRKRDFPLLMGNDSITARGRAAGADGCISGCACAIPELLVALDEATLAGERERADRLAALLAEFVDWVVKFPGPAAVKEATAERGFKIGARAVPFSPETNRRAGEFREWFRGWLPAMLKSC